MQSTIGAFQDQDLVAGDDESRRRAREERRRQQRLRFAENSTWRRIDLADLRFRRYLVEDTRTGEALTHDAAAGNPAVYVQARAGHVQATMTERYVHAAQVAFPGAAERAEERLFAVVTCHDG